MLLSVVTVHSFCNVIKKGIHPESGPVKPRKKLDLQSKISSENMKIEDL